MDARYRRYNEITFEAYCKTSICNAIRKGRIEKNDRAKREFPLSEITDDVLFKLCTDMNPTETAAQETVSFHVQGKQVDVTDLELGQALSHLTPKKRDILLMYYFWKMSDAKIAEMLGIGKSTVQWWHRNSIERLRDFIGDSK